MTIDGINIEETINKTKAVIDDDKTLSPSTKAVIEVLLLVVTLLVNRLGLNSKNSSKPPSQDPNREKKPRVTSNNKPGGQTGHEGKTLEPFDESDETRTIGIDRRTLPKGNYTSGGYERRQVVDIEISRLITEYQAEVLINEKGERFVAEFPEGVDRPIQYGNQLKAHAVYLSQYQLLPYKRIEEYFSDQLGIPISAGSIFNFNQRASALIKSSGAQGFIESQLKNADILHADETGINVNGQRNWLHCASNTSWTFFYPHTKRGLEAMADMGILPAFNGVLCHDHWKPYYHYDHFLHSLCNAHHLRELEYAWDKDEQAWAKSMTELLLEIHTDVKIAGGQLTCERADDYRKSYRQLLDKADIECPPPDESLRKEGQRGRLKRTKSRNLLERFRNFEDDVLRFMVDENVPFTNNQGENDLRMTKVQQKISGCFRSMEGAGIFCRVRGYVSSCRKQGVTATAALTALFDGYLPEIFSA